MKKYILFLGIAVTSLTVVSCGESNDDELIEINKEADGEREIDVNLDED